MYIGTQLRKIRDMRKLSQMEVAEKIGVSQATYWNWENDESHFKIDHLVKLAEIFEVDPSELLPDGAVVKIVNNKENKDNSINGFEVKMDEQALSRKLIESLQETVALLKEQNRILKEEIEMKKS